MDPSTWADFTPVIMAMSFTLPLSSGLILAPQMTFALGSRSWVRVPARDAASFRVMSGPPLMCSRQAFAPRRSTSSRGLFRAERTIFSGLFFMLPSPTSI